MKPWTVLVVGSGGREHALARRLLECESVGRVVVTPGNGGTTSDGIESIEGDLVSAADRTQPDLVVIGPEQPLVEGAADALRAKGFVVYGPSQAAAQLEASKAFMKEFALRHGIRTAKHVTVTSTSELDAALASFPAPPVVKATGLCAGKGVVVAESFEEASESARSMLDGSAFGDAGTTVVLEERLYGQEVSVHAICDGEHAVILPPIQDHKRIFDGDKGPNTGGMGTYGPAPIVTEALRERIEREVVEPVVRGMKKDGSPFAGTLFANVMVTPEGEPLLLEINVRFGDPETQVLMGLIDGDFARLLRSAALGKLEPDAIAISDRHGLCVVLAAKGYPEKPETGQEIELGPVQSEVKVYHAGTRRDGSRLVTAGGRVLGVTATGKDLKSAHRAAYAACERIHFDGMQYRRDIGYRALGQRTVDDAEPGDAGSGDARG